MSQPNVSAGKPNQFTGFEKFTNLPINELLAYINRLESEGTSVHEAQVIRYSKILIQKFAIHKREEFLELP